MGIYASNKIYGITIYNFNDDDISNTLYEEKYCEIMSHEQMREAYLFYDLLHDKKDIRIKIYTECTNTLNKNNSVMLYWHPMPFNVFLEKFNV